MTIFYNAPHNIQCIYDRYYKILCKEILVGKNTNLKEYFSFISNNFLDTCFEPLFVMRFIN